MENISRWLNTTYYANQGQPNDIKFVRSHAQAIGQCQNIITKKKFK